MRINIANFTQKKPKAERGGRRERMANEFNLSRTGAKSLWANMRVETDEIEEGKELEEKVDATAVILITAIQLGFLCFSDALTNWSLEDHSTLFGEENP